MLTLVRPAKPLSKVLLRQEAEPNTKFTPKFPVRGTGTPDQIVGPPGCAARGENLTIDGGSAGDSHFPAEKGASEPGLRELPPRLHCRTRGQLGQGGTCLCCREGDIFFEERTPRVLGLDGIRGSIP